MTVVLKDFYADWCGPCKTMDPIVEELENDFGDDLTVERVDVEEHQDVANEYNVRSLPTFVIETDEGEIDGRMIGVASKSDLADAITAAQN